MLSQEDYDQLLKDKGCVFEIRNKVCRKAAAIGSKYCPQHKAMLDALSARTAGTSPIATRRHR